MKVLFSEKKYNRQHKSFFISCKSLYYKVSYQIYHPWDGMLKFIRLKYKYKKKKNNTPEIRAQRD